MFATKNAETIRMFNLYESTCAHSRIALFFTLEKRYYMAMVESLKPEWVETDFIINENNGEMVPALRLCMKQIDFLRLRDFHGAKCLGFVKDFFKEWEDTKDDTKENKGQFVERRFIEMFHATEGKKNAAYYEDGDCSLFGEQIQIKAQNATLAKFETIIKGAKQKNLI